MLTILSRLTKVWLPSTSVEKSELKSVQEIMAAVTDWRATLRPEVVEVKELAKSETRDVSQKRLWQKRPFDHVIRNDQDLKENWDYIAMNPVKEGYVTRPEFYPYTGFLRWEE